MWNRHLAIITYNFLLIAGYLSACVDFRTSTILSLFQDLYQRFLDGDESVHQMKTEDDPFWEPTEDVLIGTANVFLQVQTTAGKDSRDDDEIISIIID